LRRSNGASAAKANADAGPPAPQHPRLARNDAGRHSRPSASTTLANVTVSQTTATNETIPVDLIDTTYEVKISSLFLQIDGQRPDSFDIDNTATYNITRGAGITASASGGTSVSLGIRLKSISSTTFSTYASTVGTNSYIRTFIRVTGLNSGATTEFEARIY
jgi:hypothetical protein